MVSASFRVEPNAPTECIPLYGCTVTVATPADGAAAARTPYQTLGMLVYAGFDGFSNYNARTSKWSIARTTWLCGSL